jgi:hypothetical protein
MDNSKRDGKNSTQPKKKEEKKLKSRGKRLKTCEV